MRKKAPVYLILPLLAFIISGCVPLIIGGAVGALGGYAASKDTIQGDTDKPYESLWQSALMFAKMRGTVNKQDNLKGYLEAEIEGNRVWVRLTRLTQATTRVRVSCRNKYKMPRLELAQDLFVKIIEQAG
jgi:hypothetical protein